MSDFDASIGETVEAFARRLDAFRDGAQTVEGPLGKLLQTIAWSQQQYAEAAERHHGGGDGPADVRPGGRHGR